jgi:hypothetical protein
MWIILKYPHMIYKELVKDEIKGNKLNEIFEPK